jgi:hypothetical protein
MGVRSHKRNIGRHRPHQDHNASFQCVFYWSILSKMYTSDEVSLWRTIPEYLLWFDDLLERKDPATKVAALTHDGPFKVFYEEIFPLASLLKIKAELWHSATFRHVLGSQPFDVEIDGLDLHYLEITTTDFDADEKFRNEVMMKRGAVDGIARVMKNEDGSRRFENEGDFREHCHLIDERLQKVRDRIIKKSSKRYPDKTALLVSVDDATTEIDDDDYPQFTALATELRPQWEPNFTTLFIVGVKSEFFMEVAASADHPA